MYIKKEDLQQERLPYMQHNSNEFMMGSHVIMDLIQANLLKFISQPYFRLQMRSQETMQVE